MQLSLLISKKEGAMGGYFSGGGRDAPKVDDFQRVDLARLKELNMLMPGRWSRLVWSRNGEEVGSIVIESHASHLIFDYRSRDHGRRLPT